MKRLGKPQSYWLLQPEARAHIDRICASMRSRPPDDPPTELPLPLTESDVADAERLLKRKLERN